MIYPNGQQPTLKVTSSGNYGMDGYELCGDEPYKNMTGYWTICNLRELSPSELLRLWSLVRLPPRGRMSHNRSIHYIKETSTLPSAVYEV